jgi:hypothetical protein
MYPSPVVEIFSRATRLALRAGTSAPSTAESFDGYYHSPWLGLSNEAKAAMAPFGGFDAITVDSLRAVLLARRKTRRKPGFPPCRTKGPMPLKKSSVMVWDLTSGSGHPAATLWFKPRPFYTSSDIGCNTPHSQTFERFSGE